MRIIDHCLCCGSDQLIQTDVLWQRLIDDWRLAPAETVYINRQQGFHCPRCGTNLRAMALAAAVMRAYRYSGLFQDFVVSKRACELRVLEINQAGLLTQFLTRIEGHTLVAYPEIDMQALPYADGSWDLVIHSDTLEHVPNPVRGLAECARVLAPDGICAFTVPMIVDRLTLSRAGMPPSYHGDASMANPDYLVQTEFGCDVWKFIMAVGFAECRVVSLAYPAAQAFLGIRDEGKPVE
ncbi:MAG: methyltransferase domain-containing protein [Thermomicrobiales bacterium]